MKKEGKFIDIYMAMAVLLGMVIFPLVAQLFFYDAVGSKANVLLIITIPYYFGLYRFRNSLFK